MISISLESHGDNLDRTRRASQLNARLDKDLLAYVAAASAAGLEMLALAQPAVAKIVYTPAHVRIGANSSHFLDLNHDGMNDFRLADAFSRLSSFDYGGTLWVQPVRQSNEISGYYSARAFEAGVKIGPGGQFRPGSPFLAQMWVTFCTGQWCNVTNRYLGLKFVVKGKTHFGWARLNVNFGSNGVVGLLTGYAYESTPNKPIIAGRTKGSDVSLGALAAGARGLQTWR